MSGLLRHNDRRNHQIVSVCLVVFQEHDVLYIGKFANPQSDFTYLLSTLKYRRTCFLDKAQSFGECWFCAGNSHVIAVLHVDEQVGIDAKGGFHHQCEVGRY